MSVGTGVVFAERYELTERIATGGMGEVWRARDRLLDRDVAVKLLKAEYADDADFLARFRAEAKHSAGMSHPNIASVFDYGEAEGTSYLVMELVSGEPLSRVLTTDGPLDTERTLDIIGQAALALDAAHQAGVIHRDVKPGNIMITPTGTVKLTDFGIARAADAVPLTQTGTVLGTAHYLSPEQANGRTVTPASDVYSLGVVFYECLAGRRPFEASNPVSIAMAHLQDEPPDLPEDVPEAVRNLVSQAMAKRPEERFATAGAFARAAASTRALVTGTAPQPTVAGAPATRVMSTMDAPSWSAEQPDATRRRRILMAVGIAVALLVIAGLVSALRPTAAEVAVPAVMRTSEASAKAALERAGFDVVIQHGYHDDIPLGQVWAVNPRPGAIAREGDTVTIAISNGPQPVRLPEGLKGRRATDVVAELRALGLLPRLVGRFSEEEPGSVLDVTPTTGLRRGSAVTVTQAVAPERGKGKDRDKDDD